MKKITLLFVSLIICHCLDAQTPIGLHVAENQVVLFGKDTTTQSNKFIWYPNKAAIRAGKATIGTWNIGGGYIGVFSAAFGFGTQAGGNYSFAAGKLNWALGLHSFAGGSNNQANSLSETSFGQYSLGGGNPNTWVTTDALFEIGNGSSGARRNTFTVQKNGNVLIGDMTIDSAATIEEKLVVHGGVVLSDAVDPTPEVGTIQWSGTDFEGWDGIGWHSLTAGSTNTGDYGTVVNPETGKVWLDRNLGATQVATSSTDADSYGDLYQWGRNADGHQIRTLALPAGLTTTLASNYFTTGGLFVTGSLNWLGNVEIHMWSGTAAENNPCPSGFRIPTAAEWEQERLTWTINNAPANNAAGAFASPLKLPMAGWRNYSSGSLGNVGSLGSYWSSTVSGASSNSRALNFDGILGGSASMNTNNRAYGCSVRCLKN